MTSSPTYAEGLVVIESKVKVSGPGRKRQKRFVLHLDTCAYLTRLSTTKARAIPAPVVPYPNTVDCTGCKPHARHRIVKRGLDAATGLYVHACACGDIGEGPSAEAARLTSHRNHARMQREETI